MWPRPVRMTMTLDVNILHCVLFPVFHFCLRLLGCTATGPILADLSAPTRLVQRLSCCSDCNSVHFVPVSYGPLTTFIIFVSCRFPCVKWSETHSKILLSWKFFFQSTKHGPCVAMCDIQKKNPAICQQANVILQPHTVFGVSFLKKIFWMFVTGKQQGNLVLLKIFIWNYFKWKKTDRKLFLKYQIVGISRLSAFCFQFNKVYT